MSRLFASILLFVMSSGVEANAVPSSEAWVWPTAYRAKKIEAPTIYLLQFHVPRSGAVRRMGPWPWAWKEKTLHLVMRFERVPNADEVVPLFEARAREWRERGVTVSGLQLDYDCATSKLSRYFEKVREIRERLPKENELSITGLADWTSIATFGDLLKSREITVFFQMYRERWQHEATPLYLQRMKKVSFPFKIGLLPEQEIALVDSEALSKNESFKGFVHFHGGPR